MNKGREGERRGVKMCRKGLNSRKKEIWIKTGRREQRIKKRRMIYIIGKNG